MNVNILLAICGYSKLVYVVPWQRNASIALPCYTYTGISLVMLQLLLMNLFSNSQDGFNWSTHLWYQQMTVMMTKLVLCWWPDRALALTIHSLVAYRFMCTCNFVLPWRKAMWSVSVLSHKRGILSGLPRIPPSRTHLCSTGLSTPLLKSWIRPATGTSTAWGGNPTQAGDVRLLHSQTESANSSSYHSLWTPLCSSVTHWFCPQTS